MGDVAAGFHDFVCTADFPGSVGRVVHSAMADLQNLLVPYEFMLLIDSFLDFIALLVCPCPSSP